jgi:Xaa-Pro dipeptidase
MTIGVGGSTVEEQLSLLKPYKDDYKSISTDEYHARILKAQKIMRRHDISAMYLNAGTNLYYFTGTKWYASERMVGAILPANGDLQYIAPHFEIGTLEGFMQIKGKVNGWQEHESPYELFGRILQSMDLDSNHIMLDESASYFITNGIHTQNPKYSYSNAKSVTAGCRMHKSETEISLMQRVKDITLHVQQAAARILYEGISTNEVVDFIRQAHIKMGATSGSYFCIVLFGEDSAFPHGVKNPKKLEKNDMVLIDTGCQIEGYISDITRSYVFGDANDRQRQIWQIEKDAQAAAFSAAQLGMTCSSVDKAARDYLTQLGLGPDYNLPGLPHRTGHGIGLDIHEWPYLVGSDQTRLDVGMCFSNEPMICVPDEFGVRLEDHFHMTGSGPKWFTQPSYSIDDPFGFEAN